ncbi:MAG: Cadherin EGF LAG seven-pass G-type receptor 1, partial [Marteilia pararefringens]
IPQNGIEICKQKQDCDLNDPQSCVGGVCTALEGGITSCKCTDTAYFNVESGECIDLCYGKICHNNGVCKLDRDTMESYCLCTEDFYGNNCSLSTCIPFVLLKNNRCSANIQDGGFMKHFFHLLLINNISFKQ